MIQKMRVPRPRTREGHIKMEEELQRSDQEPRNYWVIKTWMKERTLGQT
jgi:hypothetical protein